MKITTYIKSCFLIGLFFFNSVYAQNSEVGFIDHLYNTQQYDHLKLYGHRILDSVRNSELKNKTAFLLGNIYFQEKSFESAINYFDLLNGDYPEYNEALFYTSFSHTALKQFSLAKETLTPLPANDSLLQDFKYFQYAGIALLERDKEKFYAWNDSIQHTYYFFQKQQASLESTADQLFKRKQKSPFVGGLLTAVVPGAGRFYAGKRGQGIYSFVITSFLALQTWESYRKSGPESPRFIIYGSLLTAFHIGNIWGSALSVKNYQNEYNEAANYSIELDLLIPIRSFFK